VDRSYTSLLTLVVLMTGGCIAGTGGATLYDFDGDEVLDANDCDPSDPTIYPGADDTFGDDIDQDCDGSDGIDLDGDGYASLLSGGTDCDDSDPDLNPRDQDQDGYSTCTGDCDDSDPAMTPADADSDHYSSCTGDCDDSNAQRNPGQVEVCDLVDNDCDGVQAEDEVDIDGDGDAACSDCDDNNEELDSHNLDGDPYSLCLGDCNDDPSQAGAELIYPTAPDLVANGIDNNCDGIPGVDADRDLYASVPSGGTDCDDTEATINPGATDEVDAAALDSNCDGFDGVDADGDLHASIASGGDDCNDSNDEIYPDAPDNLGDGIDQNCDDCIDPDLSDGLFPGDGVDTDCDGYAQNGTGTEQDCDDGDPTTYPGSSERWESAAQQLDTNCDGDLYTLLADADVSFVGVGEGDESGYSVSSAGDVDGDGLDDLLIGAHYNDDGGPYAGKTYLFLGATIATAGALSLSDAYASFLGQSENDNAGHSVSSAGDVDGDGLDDLLIGADSYDGGSYVLGKTYLVYGSSIAVGGTFSLGGPMSVAGASFVGGSEDSRLGHSVSSAGDVDGDGLDDLLMGAPYSNAPGPPATPIVFDVGMTYLFLGASIGAGGSFDSIQADASFVGENEYDRSGYSVSSAGDVDGDGLSDLLIGASGNDDGGSNAGKTYLVLGAHIALGGTFDLSQAYASFVGESAGNWSGSLVSSAGDVDGDGLSDLLIGAADNDDGGSNAGKTYLVLGASVSNGTFDLSDADASFVGESPFDFSGRSASVGDVDGNGLADLLIGAPNDIIGLTPPTPPGTSYLLFSPYSVPDYAGLWTLGSATTYTCLSGAVFAQLEHVNITHRVPYANLPGAPLPHAPELTVDPRTHQPGLLEGGFVTSAIPDSFAVTRTQVLNNGNCTTTWALIGRYTGPDTLSADFTATFAGSCGDCTNQGFPVTATR